MKLAAVMSLTMKTGRFYLHFLVKRNTKREASRVAPNLSTISDIAEIISGAANWAFLPAFHKEKKKKKERNRKVPPSETILA